MLGPNLWKQTWEDVRNNVCLQVSGFYITPFIKHGLLLLVLVCFVDSFALFDSLF